MINPGQADIVRSIFRDYICGASPAAIARRLRQDNIPSMLGGKWSVKSINRIIRNEKYTGNALLQKEFIADHLKKTRKINNGQLPKYYAEGTHEAIIDPETFQKAQLVCRRYKEKYDSGSSTTRHYIFSGMLRCGHCGKSYIRKICRGRVVWNCMTYLEEGKAACHTKRIPETILISACNEVLGLSKFEQPVFRKEIKEISIPEFNTLIFIFNDGRQIRKTWTAPI